MNAIELYALLQRRIGLGTQRAFLFRYPCGMLCLTDEREREILNAELVGAFNDTSTIDDVLWVLGGAR